MSTDDLEPRVRALEERMEIQEGLRAAQDGELGVLDQRTRAIRGPLQALAVTVSEHTVRLGRIEHTVGEHTVRLDRIERTLLNTNEVLAEHVVATAASFRRIDERFDQIDGRLEQIDGRLGQIDGRFDQIFGRLEQIDGRFDQIDGRLEQSDGRFDQIDGRLSEHTAMLTTISAKLDRLAPGA